VIHIFFFLSFTLSFYLSFNPFLCHFLFIFSFLSLFCAQKRNLATVQMSSRIPITVHSGRRHLSPFSLHHRNTRTCPYQKKCLLSREYKDKATGPLHHTGSDKTSLAHLSNTAYNSHQQCYGNKMSFLSTADIADLCHHSALGQQRCYAQFDQTDLVTFPVSRAYRLSYVSCSLGIPARVPRLLEQAPLPVVPRLSQELALMVTTDASQCRKAACARNQSNSTPSRTTTFSTA
jgi:hypothetical protein